jgi:hypothetical protein
MNSGFSGGFEPKPEASLAEAAANENQAVFTVHLWQIFWLSTMSKVIYQNTVDRGSVLISGRACFTWDYSGLSD